MTAPPGPADASALVAARLGLGFPSRRRADLERGVAEAARAAGYASRARYVAALTGLPVQSAAWQRLVSRLTVRESYFFRDRAAHDALARSVLPGLIAERRESGRRDLRLWSAGCAGGEEPYSLAILLDRLLPDREDWSVTILATDVDVAAIDAARRGVFAAWSLRDTPAAERSRYFRPHGRRFALEPWIRDMVTFAPLNLADDHYPIGVDLIVCRNVVMYFTADARRAAIDRLQEALAPGGWLALGPAEAAAEALAHVQPVSFPGAVLHQRRPLPPAPLPFPPPAPEPREESDVLARRAADAGRLDEAIAHCREALRLDRLNPELHVLAAAIHHERGEHDRALAASRAAISLDPSSPMAQLLLTNLLNRRESAR